MAVRQYSNSISRYFLPVYNKLRSRPIVYELQDGLLFGLDTFLPEEVIVGKGNALYIAGWCFHTVKKIKRLEIIINDSAQPVKVLRSGRRDVMDIYFPYLDPKGLSYRSGFWTILELPRIKETVKADIQLKAVLKDGSTCVEKIGTIILKAEC